jgi:transposase InsO family protein
MTSFTVIKNLDIFKDFLLCFCAGCKVTMMHQLCLEAMAETFSNGIIPNQRKPANDLLWHSDRGSQYASESHRAILTANGITQSMSRKGNCWDNAVAESFCHSLKTELVHHCDFATRAEAKRTVRW